MGKLWNWVSTRIFKYRGIVQSGSDSLTTKTIYVKCLTCGKEFKPTAHNRSKYMFGHINCPAVYIKPRLLWDRYIIK